ncbi:hypothetical protein HDE_10168 [Halotydeus destructor]|nr:hypothetical protein HDE_10168 [Halotydeus destructor]
MTSNIEKVLTTTITEVEDSDDEPSPALPAFIPLSQESASLEETPLVHRSRKSRFERSEASRRSFPHKKRSLSTRSVHSTDSKKLRKSTESVDHTPLRLFTTPERRVSASSINSIKRDISKPRPSTRSQTKVNPLTPYKDGHISWPLRSRYYWPNEPKHHESDMYQPIAVRERSRSNFRRYSHRSINGDKKSELDRRPKSVSHGYVDKRHRQRLIDQLAGRSFIIDRKPSPQSRSGRHCRHKDKTRKHPRRNYTGKVWRQNYEFIARRDKAMEEYLMSDLSCTANILVCTWRQDEVEKESKEDNSSESPSKPIGSGIPFLDD